MKLKGKRTYLCAAAIAVSALLNKLGILDSETHRTLLQILGALALYFLRAGSKQDGKKSDDEPKA